MADQQSIVGFIASAGFVVQLVILLLVVASVVSWTIIIERLRHFRWVTTVMTAFDTHFWRATDLRGLFNEIQKNQSAFTATATIFHSGYAEYQRLAVISHLTIGELLAGVNQMMAVSVRQQQLQLEKNLSWLATIGSIAPYVGLFGTVWGIMSVFTSLGVGQQVGIAAVAPGIATALITTAIGLFVAIPAVVGYNRLLTRVDMLANQYEWFSEQFSAFLSRQLQVMKEGSRDAVT